MTSYGELQRLYHFLGGLGMKDIPTETEAFSAFILEVREIAPSSYIAPDGKVPECLRLLRNLERFSMPETRISEFPSFVCDFNHLKVLDLFGCSIRELPAEIGKLEKLEELDLWGNDIRKLPDSMGKLTRLEKLDLGYNLFRQVPEWLGNFSRLKVLSLECTGITHLPECISKLPLEECCLAKNDFSEAERARATQWVACEIDWEGS